VVVPVSTWLTVRPDLTFSQSSGDSTSPTLLILGDATPVVNAGSSSLNHSKQVSVGLSALFYVGRWDALRTYVSPRFAYGRGTSSSSALASTTDLRSSNYVTAGSFGAQYALGRHFGLFGEVGMNYTTATTTVSASVTFPVGLSSSSVSSASSVQHMHGVSTRSSTGVIFYF